MPATVLEGGPPRCRRERTPPSFTRTVSFRRCNSRVRARLEHPHAHSRARLEQAQESYMAAAEASTPPRPQEKAMTSATRHLVAFSQARITLSEDAWWNVRRERWASESSLAARLMMVGGA